MNPPAPVSEAPLVVVAGPTGVGKSLFAAELASRLGGEIICADAFQVYAGLEILTAQPGPALCAAVPHHLYGRLPVAESFDAAKFRSLALAEIAAVRARGRLPILVGGSGLYLKAVTHGLDELPPPDPALRAGLAALSPDELRCRLDTVDPAARRTVDFQNPRRVQRALEIVQATGRPVAESRRGWTQPDIEFRGLLLTRERDDLRARIAENVAAMFERGVVSEVASLGSVGPTAGRAIGLREIRAHLRGEIDAAECAAAITTATVRYAKRQLTWFRNQLSLFSIDLTGLRHPREFPESIQSARQFLGAA